MPSTSEYPFRTQRKTRIEDKHGDARIPVEVRLLNVQIPIASGNVRRFVSQETIDAYCRAEGENALDRAKKALQVMHLSEIPVTMVK